LAPRFIAPVWLALSIYFSWGFFFVAGAACTLTLLQLSHENIFSSVVILAQFVCVRPHCLGLVLWIFIFSFPYIFLYFYCTFSVLFYLWLVQQNISASGEKPKCQV